MHTSIHIQMYYERKHSDTSCIEILRFLVTVGHVTQYMWVWCAKVLLLRQAASSWQQARLDTLVRSPTPSGLPSPNLHNAIEGEKSTPLCGHCLGQKVAPNEINRNNAGVLGTASHFFFFLCDAFIVIVCLNATVRVIGLPVFILVFMLVFKPTRICLSHEITSKILKYLLTPVFACRWVCVQISSLV